MFDGVPVSVCSCLKSVAIFGENCAEVIGVVDEKPNVIELISPMKLSQKSSRRLFRPVGNRLTWKTSFVRGSTASYRQNSCPCGGSSSHQPRVDPQWPSRSAV